MYILLILLMLASMGIQWILKSKMIKYAKTPLNSNLSGQEVAEMMLRDNFINDVVVKSVAGQLTDHYDPTNKTVNLSQEVYYGRNAAAVAVAAHEVGHAVQHAQAYAWLGFRSAMVPMLSFSSRYMSLLLIAGILMLNFSWIPLAAGVALFSLTTLFSFITLPVEFDASARGLNYLTNRGVVTSSEYALSKDALRWAAMTYVVAAISSLATLLYYLSILSGRSSRD
ncbi:MAG TPA: zinc metallopeptidase [Catalimonadaceae bacterium]|nr:zinc metallopeptidase [Catalimonadaceae bacterium]